ncbi:hypothetical protein EDD22DRAFT_982274 [Suillus occidentalis]|nr:hypothetical protein EDD22DRAFT_982274 [Suillus occidentalis]
MDETRKPQEKPAPNKQHSQTVTKNKDAPTTSAKPHKSQAEIVLHFEKELTGALAFSQSALSRALKRWPELEAPDVERALFTWIKHMEIKGDMFEEEFDVPEEERLSGDGWIASFCRTYKIQEHRQHGEAGSVNLDDVTAKCTRCQKILAKYAPKDRWNFDETSFFPL